MMTDVTIISERGGSKEEAGMIQDVMARPDKRRLVALRGKYLQFLSLGDNCRSWQGSLLSIHFSLPPQFFSPTGPFPRPEVVGLLPLGFSSDSPLSGMLAWGS